MVVFFNSENTLAEEKEKKTSSKSALSRKPSKKTQTVRERASSSQTEKKPGRRLRSATGKASGSYQKARDFGRQEYNLPLPDNRVGKVLGKRVRIVPKFVREAWAEIKQVTWPNRKETIRLTLAVFVFAIVFAGFVGVLDYVLGELFERFIVNANK